MSKRRFIALLCLCLIIVPAFADKSGEEKLSSAILPSFSSDARYLSMSGAGVALENPTLSFDTNPAGISSWNTGFSTPYVSFALSNPDKIIKYYDTPSAWGNTVTSGFLPVAEMNAGFNARFRNFGFDLRVSDGLYSYAQSNSSAGRSALAVNVTDVSLGFAAGFKFYWKWNLAFSCGLYTALDAETRTNVLTAGSFSDVLSEGTLSTFIKEGAAYLSSVKVPLSLGFVFEMPYGFAVGGVARNRTIIVTEQLYSESGEKFCDKFKEDPKFIFDTILNIKYVNAWTGDFGFSWDLSRLLVSSEHNLSVALDLVEIRSLIELPETWLGHIKAGMEYTYQNISLRAGWQLSGPSFGLGLSFPGVTIDLSYGHAMNTGNSSTSGDFFTPENNQQVAITLKVGK